MANTSVGFDVLQALDVLLSFALKVSFCFKKFNLARVVGETTRGWGTVENTYPLTTVIDPSETYSLLLVNSLTLRDDNLPIEGRGVDPDVNVKNLNWKNELGRIFRNTSLIKAVTEMESAPPLR